MKIGLNRIETARGRAGMSRPFTLLFAIAGGAALRNLYSAQPLLGLAGLAGALPAQRADRSHDRGWSAPATGAGLLLALISLLIADAGKHSIIVLLIAVVLLGVAIQAVNILNQKRLFAVDPQRLLWQLDRWPAVTLAGAVLIVLALVVWLTQRSALAIT